MGYAQNIAQLESSFETNKKKRKASEAFDDDDFDYLYGIVTTGKYGILIVFLMITSLKLSINSREGLALSPI